MLMIMRPFYRLDQVKETPGQDPFADWPTRGGEVSYRATNKTLTTR